MWNRMQLFPEQFQPLFIMVPAVLSRAIFKSLYEIEWSPEGSNKKSREDDTLYCWELYLKKIEGTIFNQLYCSCQYW